MIYLWLAAFLTLAATAVLAALSRALLHVSPSQLERELERRGTLERGRWILDHLERVEWATAFLRTFGRISFFGLTLLMVVGIDGTLGLEDMALAAVISVVLVWMFTSVVAGGIARYAPDTVIASCLPALRGISVALYPLIWLGDRAELLVRRAAGSETREERQENELLSSIEDTQREGVIDEVSAAILENAVEFHDTTVGAVMTPRAAIRAMPYTDDLAAVRQALEAAGHSRVPVYNPDLDHVVGVLHVRDMVPYLGSAGDGFVLRPLLREPMRVPESKPVREQLLDFQRAKVHIAMVLDEYGGVTGLVTIEDLLEELVGEIRDEHEPPSADVPDLRLAAPGMAEVRGSTPVHELNEALGLTIPEDEAYETVAGFLLDRLGRIPEVGTLLQKHGARFEVLRASPTTVDQVRVTLLHENPDSDAE